jgi:hypothetical protein
MGLAKDENPLELLGDKTITATSHFDNYYDWVELRKRYLGLGEEFGSIDRYNLAIAFFYLTRNLLNAKSQRVRAIPMDWSQSNIQFGLKQVQEMKPLAQKSGTRVRSDTKGHFDSYQQEGTKCIAEVIAGCLTPYGIGINFRDLYDKRVEDAVSNGFDSHHIFPYMQLLRASFGVESKMVDSPFDFLGFLVCGYPLVGINRKEWHAYATTGHNFAVNFQNGVSVKELEVLLQSTGQVQRTMSFDQLKTQLGCTWLVLNPVPHQVSE